MPRRTVWGVAVVASLLLMTGCASGGLGGSWAEEPLPYELNHGTSEAELFKVAQSTEPELAAEIGETGTWNVAVTSCMANYHNDDGSAAVEALVKPGSDEQHEQLNALRLAVGDRLCPGGTHK